MSNEEYFDEELDLCLDLISRRKYENILHQLLTIESSTWVNLKDFLSDSNIDITFSEQIEFLWLSLPPQENEDMIIILFLNKFNMEIVSAFYNRNILKKEDRIREFISQE